MWKIVGVAKASVLYIYRLPSIKPLLSLISSVFISIILFKYCVDVENCGRFKGFGFIYIYIYIDKLMKIFLI